jgi:hypothetical protein
MRMRRLGLAVVLALGMALVPTAAHAGPTDDIHSLVNQARWSNGQAGLLRNAAMDQVAANWAAQLAANGTLSHNPNYSSEIPGGWTAAAENVAQGYGSGAAMHEGWMNSPGHRANVLGGFTDIGIAFLSSGGTTWGVQVFANYPGHVGPAAPAPPAPPPPSQHRPRRSPRRRRPSRPPVRPRRRPAPRRPNPARRPHPASRATTVRPGRRGGRWSPGSP